MIIGIDAGHCLSGPDTGAQGNGMREEVITREIASDVIRRLQELGHKVVVCTRNSAESVPESLNYRVNTANNSNVDIFVSIHINSGGGKGSEVYTNGGKPLVEANNILTNLESLGFYNRGIKNGSNLVVIKRSKMKAMLIEVFYIDTLSDVNLYKKLSSSKIAHAIVRGLVGEGTDIKTEIPGITEQQVQPKKTWEINIKGNIAKIFQRELNNQFGANLKVDGYIGDNTINKLITVRRGARGNITKTIQELLIRKGYTVGQYGADGVFGQETQEAVERFQKARSLTVDGIIGKNTWKELLKE